MAKDYYQILGINKNATKEEIKKAYKQLAKKYHPDVSKDPQAGEKFKEINEAVSILGDDNKRGRYDQYGTAEDYNTAEQGFSGFDARDFGTDFSDIFDSVFGGGFGGFNQRQHRQQQGIDLEYQLEITLEDAAFGVEKNIVIPRLEQCDHCKGSGAKDQHSITTCSTCQGTGTHIRRQRTPFGIFQSSAPCKTCRGTGQEIKEYCHSCEGYGRVKKNREVKVKIPQGIATGSRLRMTGEGEAGERNAPTGDLYIHIIIKTHKIFTREGDDIRTESPLPFTIAALGGEIKVATLEGEATIKIPVGTQTNSIFVLRGKGIPHLRGHGSGDEKVKVVVQVPTSLTKKQKELLKEFEEELNKKKGVIDKIKDVFE